MTTILALIKKATSTHGDKVALRQNNWVLTYEALDQYSSQLANRLREKQLLGGKHVALLLRDSPEYVISLLAIWKAGCVAVPFSHLVKKRELTRVLKFCDVKGCICTSDTRNSIQNQPCIDVDRQGIWTDQGSETWQADHSGASDSINAEHNALLIHTSGTTSDPKTVQLTHRNLYYNVGAIVQYLKLTSSDRVLCILPFHYVYGNSVLLTHLSVGAEIVFGSSMMYPQQVVNELEQFEITGFSGVASTYHLLLSRTNWSQRAFSSLRFLTQAGGPMPYPQIEKLLSQTRKQVEFIVMYGQTEASARLTYLPPSELIERQGSVGIPIDGVELRIVDAKHQPLPPFEIGVVCAKGKNIMRGYWKSPQATDSVLANGWLHTGDLGYLDADGYLFLRSRKSDIIKTGAHRVDPQELEELISELSEVGVVAVIGVEDDFLGEHIRVVIEGSENRVLSRAIMRHCQQNLPTYKMPKEVVWINEMPRTHSGKIKKNLLKHLE